MNHRHRNDVARTVLVGYARPLVTLVLSIAIAGCSSLGASGPSSTAIASAGGQLVENAGIVVIDVTDAPVRTQERPAKFSEIIGDAPITQTVIGAGDVIDVAIWESPPAMLFGSTSPLGGTDASSVMSSTGGGTQRTGLPEMMVDSGGRIQIPFAGSINVAGRTPTQVQNEIKRRLSGKAHDPQVVVQLVRNATANVTVVGEVGTSTRVPLSARGERLLDVLATAGGVKQPTGKMTIQVTRGERVASMPLDSIIRDPSQDIRLAVGDVIAATFQPYSFTSLGATGTSAEVPFESTGLTLSQALGRMAGLKDDRANVSGIFIFRLEEAGALNQQSMANARRTPEGKIPVIYRADLKNPATFFVAQNFPIKNKDVIYVSSARLSDLQRFVQLISSLVFPVIGLTQAIP